MAKRTAGIEEENVTFEIGSGNVYADLGYADPEEMAAKAELVRAIARATSHLGVSQINAGKLMSIDQPTLSKLLRGRVRNFTIDRLSGMLRSLGRNVILYVEEPDIGLYSVKNGARGHFSVLPAAEGPRSAG